ncbi:MAG: hypothetical protein IT161_17195 [Bryobacterales bacterium]|nr:hypothetical protein [Bryobacterales bacterium]
MAVVQRRTVHLGLIASLLVAFAQAPFLHVHASDPHHAHAKGLTHAHWAGAASHQPGFDQDSHAADAKPLDWLAGDGTAPVRFVATLPESVSLPEPRPQRRAVLESKPPAHDTVWRASLHPRAPPA